MNMLPSVLIDKELRVSDFKLSSEFFENFSFLFYGFELKSEYDNKRHSIHKSLKPKKFAHLVKTKNGMDAIRACLNTRTSKAYPLVPTALES